MSQKAGEVGDNLAVRDSTTLLTFFFFRFVLIFGGVFFVYLKETFFNKSPSEDLSVKGPICGREMKVKM